MSDGKLRGQPSVPFWDVIGVGVMVAAIVGCGPASDLAPAGGTVTLEGQTFAGGKVLFSPIGGGGTAIGEIDPQGHFVLTTNSGGDGAKIGRHRVTIVEQRDDAREEARLTYSPPRNLEVQVKADVENKFSFDIRRADGWQVVADD